MNFYLRNASSFPVFVCLASFLMFQTSPVIADDWNIGVGGGVFVTPEYLGSEDLEVLVFPAFDIAYQDRIFFNFYEGLSGYLYRSEQFKLKGGLGFGSGRDEDDENSFEGLGDIDDSTVVKLTVEFQAGRYSPFFNLQKHLGGTDGVQAQIGIGAFYLLREELTGPLLLLNFGVQYSDEDYLMGYFGIDGEQSTRTGLPAYSPNAGVDAVNAGVTFAYPITQEWRLTAFLQYVKIIGDAGDSTLVLDDKAIFGGTLISYRF